MKVSTLKMHHEHHPMRPTRQIAISFLAVILIGSVLLMLPICNNTTPTAYLNNLFIATSATCVTGLVPVVTSEQFNILGQIVIIILIQIGGLGFLTFLNLLLIMVKKKISLTNKLVLQEALNQPSLNDLPKFVKNVIKYTFIVEGLGAIILAFVFIPDFGIVKGIYYSIFHSISAFCNAGFDVLGANSLIGYQNNLIINLVIPGLIIMGGLGFVVWFDVAHCIKKEYGKRSKFSKKHLFKSFSLHTKLVIIATVVLLLAGAVLFYLCEFNNIKTIGGLPLFDQIQISFFQSATLRTAVFASVDMASLHPSTKLMMCVLMFIGGSPAGTAGGIKTVTVGVLMLCAISTIRGNEQTTVFKRRIPLQIITRALTIIMISVMVVFTVVGVLSLSEDFTFMEILFETISAFATVGTTLGITPLLSITGKITIIIVMFIGRLGPITMAMALMVRQSKNKGNIQYPEEKVMVG